MLRRSSLGLVICTVGIVLFLLMSVAQASHAAQLPIAPSALEVGLRVPLAGLVALPLGETIRLEASVVIPGFSAPLVDSEGRLAAKFYPALLATSVGELPLRPFLGAGVVLLQAVGEWIPGLSLLIGAETAAPGLELPLTLFAEGSVTFLQGEGLGKPKLELSLGVRYALPLFEH